MDSQQVKSSINLILPLGVSSVIAYKAWQNKYNWQAVIGLLLLSWFVLWLITRSAVKLVSSNATPSDANILIGGNSNGMGTGSSIINTFAPEGWADSLKADIYSGAFTERDHRLYDSLAKMSTDKLVAIYQVWQDKYYSKDRETLIQAMNGEHYGNGWFEGGLFGGLPTTKNVATIIDKLRSAGLN